MTADMVAKIPEAPGVFDVGLPFYVEIPETDSAPPRLVKVVKN